MLFNSWQYAVFLPLVVALYWMLPHKVRWVLLLVASYYFYMSWNANLVVLILTTTATSYTAALLIDRARAAGNLRRQKLWLWLGIGVSLAMLFFFKYFNFFSASVTAVLRACSLPVDDFMLQVMLPVGISFYTFQTLSYVIDVYRGKLAPERHFGLYALYVSFFPQLVAGPIERAINLLPQMRAVKHPDAAKWAWGLRLLCWGLLKKVAVADFLAPFVNTVFDNVQGCGPMAYILAGILFTVQVFCDFSGYSDIARGSATLMGFTLMQNFNGPFLARSIKEFWRRWHISLSTWFSDYIYIPLGGSRVSMPRHLCNLFITFLISGLWHGAKWTFVLWGALHGVLLIVDVFFLPWRDKHVLRLPRPLQHCAAAVETFVTFGLVCFAFLFFRANSVADLGLILSRLPWALSAPGQGLAVALSTMGITSAALMRIVLSCAALFAYDWIARHKGDPFTLLQARRGAVRWTVNYALAFLLLLAVFTQPENVAVEFIYFQF